MKAKTYYRATRPSGECFVHASQTIGSTSKEPHKTDPIQFTVWEPSSLMGPHTSIGSRADYGDGGEGWVGELVHRRIESTLPVGEERFAFFAAERARLLRSALKMARKAFPEFKIRIKHGYIIGR